MPTIRPFKDLFRGAPGDRDIIGAPGFWRRLNQALGSFAISIDGGDLSQPNPDELHFKISSAAGSGSLPPFFVTIVDTMINVAPGLVYCAQALDPTGTSGRKRWAVPLINDIPLDAAEPPALIMPAGGSGFVCLKVTFYRSGEVSNWPWSIIFSATEPGEIDIIRDTGGNHSGTLAARDGEYYILIATIKEGAVYQWVRGNICANLQWEELFTFA